MKRGTFLTVVISILLVSGCQQKSTSQTAASAPASVKASAQLSPEDLGVLGAKIKKDPSHAQQLLSDSGLTESEFEAAIRKVAADPAASRRYADAFHKAT